MAWRDWLDVKNLQLTCKHTVSTIAAVFSYVLVFWLVRWGLGEGVIASIVEFTEQVVLVVTLLVYLFQLLYDVWVEARRNVRSSRFLLA